MKLATMTQVTVDGVMRGSLTRWLLENDLVKSRVDSKGVTIQVYRPAGRLQYAAN